MKKLRCKKQYGTWYYTKEVPSIYNDFDAPVYNLFDENQHPVMSFGCYDEMKFYVETGHTY